MTRLVRHVPRWRRSIGPLALMSLAAACTVDRPTDPPLGPSLDLELRQALEGWGAVLPIVDVPRQNAALVDLGRSLFFDKELSGNRDIACGTCHEPADALTDRMSLAVGTGGLGSGAARLPGQGRQFVPRNAPSLLNLGITFPYLFWDGRVAEFGFNGPPGPGGFIKDPKLPSGLSGILAAQAMLPILNRLEMRGRAGDKDRFGHVNELAEFPDSAATQIWAATMRRLLAINEYVARFNAAFPGVPNTSLGFQHAANAIAAFQLDAFTATNSAFDRFLKRDPRGMSDDAKRGGILFFGRAQCASCHSGPLLGGQQFANIGIPQLGPGVSPSAPLDKGHGDVVALQGGVGPNPDFYAFAFRVPPLRNVELTAPYMHNGAYPTLEVVVRHYTNADSALRFYDVTQVDQSLRGTLRGDAATIEKVRKTMDFRLQQKIPLTTGEQRQLVAFLKSLTDPSARLLAGVVPARVPSGLPVRE